MSIPQLDPNVLEIKIDITNFLNVSFILSPRKLYYIYIEYFVELNLLYNYYRGVLSISNTGK